MTLFTSRSFEPYHSEDHNDVRRIDTELQYRVQVSRPVSLIPVTDSIKDSKQNSIIDKELRFSLGSTTSKPIQAIDISNFPPRLFLGHTRFTSTTADLCTTTKGGKNQKLFIILCPFIHFDVLKVKTEE